MKRNISFYERYKREQKQKQMEEKFRQKYNIDSEKTVVVESKSKIDKLIIYLKEFFGITLKLSIYTLITILSTIGATVLLNQSLRDTFFEVIKIIM